MDTDKLNHELQIFRNHVKIARENIIHKLIRDIKFWKAKHESNADNKRAARKQESLEALMGHIKAQPASELAKAVIRFNPKKCGAGLEERALMRFHENKKLLPEVKALIRRFGLGSKMEVLDKYLKSRTDGKKGKAGKKGKKVKKREKVPKERQPEEQESEDQGFCEAAAEDDGSVGSISKSNSEDVDEEEVGKFVKLTPAKVKKPVKEIVEKKSKKVEKKPKEKKDFKPPEEEDIDDKCIQIQDSFFVTSSGQNYVATAPVVDKKQQQQEEEEEFSWKRANKRKDILGKKEERPQKRPFGKDADERNDDIHPSWKAKQQQQGIKQFQGQRKSFGEKELDDSDLHPSWAAKQKQRSLQPFAGKKIKFESTEAEPPSVGGEDLHPSWAAKQKQKGLKPFQGKKIVFDSSEQAESSKPADDIHPSWAAKQKQKGLKPFEGKKIVFDTNEDKRETVTPAAVPSDLHPSWAAKQKEKGIQEFRGKKITFDD